jgi:hypothetical protein
MAVCLTPQFCLEQICHNMHRKNDANQAEPWERQSSFTHLTE